MNLPVSIAAGMATGVFFYVGLWLTVRHLLVTRHPVGLTLASFWGRTFIALAAFVLIAQCGWRSSLAALAGFALARVLVAARLPAKEGQPRCT